MKLFLFSLIFSINSFFLFGQDSISIKTCEHYSDNNYTGSDTYITRYDSAGNILRNDFIGNYIDPYDEEPEYSWHDYTLNEYNLSGQVINRKHYKFDSEYGLIFLEEHWYTYDAAGNTLTDSSDHFYIPNRKIVYGWNSNNDTTSIELYEEFSGMFLLVDQKIIQRDAGSRPIDRQHITFSNGVQTNVSRQLISYDVNGNITSYHHMEGIVNGWEDEWRMLSDYSSLGLKDAYGYSKFLNSSWLLFDTLNYVFNPDSTIQHSFSARWWNGILSDSTRTYNTYDSNGKIVFQLKDFYWNFNNGLIHDSLNIIINRNVTGDAVDSTILRYNVNQFERDRIFWFDYPHPDTIHRFEINCYNGTCPDTLELDEQIFPGPGNTNYHNIYFYNSGSLSPYDFSASVYNSNGQLILKYSHYTLPGEQSHSHREYTYDSNGNMISSYSRSSGHAGTPVNENYCNYNYILDTSSVLNATVFLTDTFSCQTEGIPGYLLITGGTPPYTITWDDTTGIALHNTVQPIFFPDTTTNYVLHVTDSLGQQVTKNIIVDGEYNHIQISATGSCIGDTISALINPPLSSPANFSLLNYDEYFASNDSAFFIIQPNYWGHLYISLDTECGILNNSDSVHVQDFATINLYQDRYLCGGDSVLLNPDYTGSVTWFDGDTSHYRYFSTPGTYWATSITSQCEAIDSVNVFNTPFSLSLGPDTVICTNHQIELIADSGFIFYQWSNNTGQQHLFYSAITEDTATIWVNTQDQHWCMHSDSINVISVICSNTEEISRKDFLLFPNPVKNYFTVKFPFVIDGYIALYNLTGELLTKNKFTGESITDEMKYPPGIYILKIISDKKEFVFKMVHY